MDMTTMLDYSTTLATTGNQTEPEKTTTVLPNKTVTVEKTKPIEKIEELDEMTAMLAYTQEIK
jgi:hypothetical protein